MVRKIMRELLDNLPSEIHRQVAIEFFIKTGEWVIVDNPSDCGTSSQKSKEEGG